MMQAFWYGLQIYFKTNAFKVLKFAWTLCWSGLWIGSTAFLSFQIESGWALTKHRDFDSTNMFALWMLLMIGSAMAFASILLTVEWIDERVHEGRLALEKERKHKENQK